jgi:hypothetical protein
MLSFVPGKWALVVKVIPYIIAIIVLKLLIHQFKWEFLSLSSLFNSIIAANVFLLGFLLSGTLTDYKESEKLPGELSGSIETMSDECLILYKQKKAKEAKQCFQDLISMTTSIKNWFYKKERTRIMMDTVAKLNDSFLAFEAVTQPNFIVRLKQEQNNIRRMLIRIHTIRETSFVEVGYAIAESTTFLLVFAFIFARIEPFYESIFFVGVSTFLMIYVIALIKSLDNPFDHYENEKGTALVSLKPLLDIENKLKKEEKELFA